MDKKSLKDISWNVTESDYRQDPALSYSTLARFEREGFEALSTLFDKVESPSLTFGSCVDCIITEGEQEFNNRFKVADIPSVEPSVEPVVKELFTQNKNAYTSLFDIPDSVMMPVIAAFAYQPRWKPETRCKVIREKGQAYYQTLFTAKDKTIIPQELYNKVFACVRALKDSEQTKQYFQDNPFDGIERFYQLKFKENLNGIDYRCMADLLMVDHASQTVTPVDLKTSSKREYKFYESFATWRYDIQARLYWRIIRQAMDKDDYFRNFILHDYRFIVVSSTDKPIPLVWDFYDTRGKGLLKIGKYSFRDPEEIGKELFRYLKESPELPDNIEKNKINSITEWLEKNN